MKKPLFSLWCSKWQIFTIILLVLGIFVINRVFYPNFTLQIGAMSTLLIGFSVFFRLGKELDNDYKQKKEKLVEKKKNLLNILKENKRLEFNYFVFVFTKINGRYENYKLFVGFIKEEFQLNEINDQEIEKKTLLILTKKRESKLFKLLEFLKNTKRLGNLDFERNNNWISRWIEGKIFLNQFEDTTQKIDKMSIAEIEKDVELILRRNKLLTSFLNLEREVILKIKEFDSVFIGRNVKYINWQSTLEWWSLMQSQLQNIYFSYAGKNNNTLVIEEKILKRFKQEWEEGIQDQLTYKKIKADLVVTPDKNFFINKLNTIFEKYWKIYEMLYKCFILADQTLEDLEELKKTKAGYDTWMRKIFASGELPLAISVLWIINETKKNWWPFKNINAKEIREIIELILKIDACNNLLYKIVQNKNFKDATRLKIKKIMFLFQKDTLVKFHHELNEIDFSLNEH